MNDNGHERPQYHAINDPPKPSVTMGLGLLVVAHLVQSSVGQRGEPFVFSAWPAPPGQAASAPLITSIEPDQAAPGDTIVVQGEDFTGTV
jgi:hypothetical protein